MECASMYSSRIFMQEVLSFKQVYLMSKSMFVQLLIKSLFNSEAFFQSREISPPAAECRRPHTEPRACQLLRFRPAQWRHPHRSSCGHPEPVHPLPGSRRHPRQQTAGSARQGRQAKSPEGGQWLVLRIGCLRNPGHAHHPRGLAPFVLRRGEPGGFRETTAHLQVVHGSWVGGCGDWAGEPSGFQTSFCVGVLATAAWTQTALESVWTAETVRCLRIKDGRMCLMKPPLVKHGKIHDISLLCVEPS